MVSALCVIALACAHPLHASTALVDIGPDGTGQVTIRAFADQVPWSTDSTRADAYLDARFLILSGGRRVPFDLMSTRSDQDAVIFTLRLTAPAGCEGLRVWHGVLAERYVDQVNLVQVRCGGRQRQLVFSAGDGSKPA